MTVALPQTPLLSQRYSARRYTGESIPPEAVRSLLEAARWAPSSRNGQPWSFIVAARQDQAEFAALLDCMGGNIPWCQDAALLLACVARRDWEDRPLPNRHAWHDIGLAVMAMAVQGVSLGLQMREMGGIDAAMTRERYHIPETHDVVTGLAVGVPGDTAAYLAERHRKPLSDFVFQGDWGRAAPVAGD